jgi:hypothetical protein
MSDSLLGLHSRSCTLLFYLFPLNLGDIVPDLSLHKLGVLPHMDVVIQCHFFNQQIKVFLLQAKP